MCDKELIVGYLYGELSREERETLDTHLAACAECRIEVEELRSARQHLTLWHPPEPDLGFRVIRGGAAPAPALPRRSRFVAAGRLAAAAVIVLAAGAAVANLEVRYGSDGVVVRTGLTRSNAGDAQAPAAASPAAAMPASASGDLAALDRRLREIEATLSAAPSSGPDAQSASARMSDAEMLRQVRRIVADAEARQDTAVAERLLAVYRDFDVQRRTDLALIQQGLGRFQSLTNAEIAQNRDMVNQLVRAAARQEK
jgi:hypothetical protein